MLSFEGLAKNFRFMVLQVTKQLENTLRLLEDPNPRLIKAIQDSDDYIDTLKSMIEKDCFAFLGSQKVREEAVVDAVRALTVITNNLERIADFSVNIARQMQRLHGAATLRRFDYRAYFDLLLEGVGLITQSLLERDSANALRICQIEDQLDRLYGAHLDQIVAELREAREVENLITVLFVLHYLERMGDALLNIGEAIIFAVLGERLKIRQYRAIEGAVDAAHAVERPLTDTELAGIWGTRSGVRVGTVTESPREDAPRRVLFKEGNPEKLQAEKESLQRWEQIAPGLAPRVVEFEQHGTDAALLLQYLDGSTLQDLALNAESDAVSRAMQRVETTLGEVWRTTRQSRPANGEFLRQLFKRIDDVYRVHPELRYDEVRIGEKHVPAVTRLLDLMLAVDESLPAPFSVFIHGDFNLDNIIYNREADTLHFVDLHRSREMDYVQDVSVFLVSGFRLPVFVPRVRLVLEALGRRFLRFGRSFAREQGDETFEARLALGLVRSLVTSTRFELNRDFARAMYQRALYLLQKLEAHDRQAWASFRVPDSVLIY